MWRVITKWDPLKGCNKDQVKRRNQRKERLEETLTWVPCENRKGKDKRKVITSEQSGNEGEGKKNISEWKTDRGHQGRRGKEKYRKYMWRAEQLVCKGLL